MKCVSVEPALGSPGRVLPIFSSAEEAYVWFTEANQDPEILEKLENVDKVELLPGHFIEAEWRGCEYAYQEGGEHVRIDLVRLAKAHQPENASGLLVSVHYGWTLDCVIPFRDYNDEFIDVRVLLPGANRLDLSTLFKDDE